MPSRGSTQSAVRTIPVGRLEALGARSARLPLVVSRRAPESGRVGGVPVRSAPGSRRRGSARPENVACEARWQAGVERIALV